MEKSIIQKLHDTAEEFGSIARKVNESSKKRKQHSENAIEHIHQSLEIGEKLDKDLDAVAKSNLKLRDQDTRVFNTCLNLKEILAKEKELISKLDGPASLNADTGKQMLAVIDEFSKTLDESIANLESIINSDNKIILLDRLIITRKKFQQESIKKLNKLAVISLEDAEKAINGSSSNLERGLQMVENYKQVKDLVDKKDKKALQSLAEEANRGWNIAVDVNTSSKSQFEFAEQVNKFTQELHDDSMAIRKLIEDKHHAFEQNLQTITVLTVNISLGFKKYLDIENMVESLEPGEDLETFNSLNAYIKIACQDIRYISALNYDMTDSIHLNNAIETKAVAMSKEELSHYDSIKSEVNAMTNATKYPVEGSGKNIDNGKILEEEIKKLIT